VCVLKKLHLIKVGAFAWYSIKIRIIFGVRFERRKIDKKQTYMKTKACKPYFRVLWTFKPNFVKIDPYSFELYRFKVGACFWDTVYNESEDELAKHRSSKLWRQFGELVVDESFFSVCSYGAATPPRNQMLCGGKRDHLRTCIPGITCTIIWRSVSGGVVFETKVWVSGTTTKTVLVLKKSPG